MIKVYRPDALPLTFDECDTWQVTGDMGLELGRKGDEGNGFVRVAEFAPGAWRLVYELEQEAGAEAEAEA